MDCITNISKSGRNLNARIPDDWMGRITRGDKVKIVLVEKRCSHRTNLKEELIKYLKNPNCEKLKGTIMGYPIELPLSRLINNMPLDKAEKLFYDLLTNR